MGKQKNYQRMIEVAAGLNDVDSITANPEYLRGQAELIADSCGLGKDKEDVIADIIAKVKGSEAQDWLDDAQRWGADNTENITVTLATSNDATDFGWTPAQAGAAFRAVALLSTQSDAERLPVDIEDIAAQVAGERGLGAGGPDTYQTFIRVAELTAQHAARGARLVRNTDNGIVDILP